MCDFDRNLLPIRLNLPMVCKPLEWEPRKNKDSHSTFLTLADYAGGYLSGVSADNRFHLLTSHDSDYFYIKLKDSKSLLSVLNTLQSQVFEINKKVLSYILDNRDRLEEAGILMNRLLAKVNLPQALDLLRFCYINDKGMKDVCSCNTLLNDFSKWVQRARYEEFIFTLASAYAGYPFDLPTFMDFRGRIYRAGVLHFHERDLARSLIFFSNDKEPELIRYEEFSKRKSLANAAAFKFNKFSTLTESFKWYMDTVKYVQNSDEKFINLAQQASDPFQFISKYLSIDRVNVITNERILGLNRVPVTQDASASAYQIMSYLLLNAELGRRTNLLPSPEKEIQDFYLCLTNELKEFLYSILDNNKYAIIESRLTRKLIKRLFMPLIYGKSVITMASDIRDVYGSLLSYKDHFLIAQLCYEFWKIKYPDIANFMKLINLIGWFCAALNRSVHYSIEYFTTVQDYMRSQKAQISVYDRMSKKRRRVTLRVPTGERDKRKTQVSTCVNFIHQKDAFIAMKVVEILTNNTNSKAPIYTVHENFITTSIYAGQNLDSSLY